jgi:hypothetical protein
VSFLPQAIQMRLFELMPEADQQRGTELATIKAIEVEFKFMGCCDSGKIRRCMSEQRAHRMNEWING